MTRLSTKTCSRCGEALLPGTDVCPACLLLGLEADGPDDDEEDGDLARVRDLFAEDEIVIERRLGHGGMGVIFEVYHPGLGRRAALKVPDPKYWFTSAILRRFEEREMSQAQLRHPNIVLVHEAGHRRGVPYMICERIEGVDLREHLRARRFDAQEALAIIRQLASALEYVHDHEVASKPASSDAAGARRSVRESIVHRDLKPENVLLEGDVVKLTDFGLAVPVGTTRALTGPGGLGTDIYSAPEVRGGDRDVDGRADVYSLGILLHELLTSTVPVGEPGETPLCLAERLKMPTEPASRLERLLTAMISAQRSARPESMGYVLAEVDNILDLLERDRVPPMSTEFWKWLRHDAPWFMRPLVLVVLVTITLALGGAMAGGELALQARRGLAICIAISSACSALCVATMRPRRTLQFVRTAKARMVGPWARLWHHASTPPREDAAVDQVCRLAVALFLSSTMLYTLFVGSDVKELAVVGNTINNAMSAIFVLLYLVLHENTVRIDARVVRKTLLAMCAVVVGLGALEHAGLLAYGKQLSGIAGAAAMSLFVSRLESKFIFPPRGVKAVLYTYAAVQPAYALFWEDEPVPAIVFWSLGLIGKLLLFLFLYWSLAEGRLLFYMHEIAKVHNRVDAGWRRYESRWLDPLQP